MLLIYELYCPYHRRFNSKHLVYTAVRRLVAFAAHSASGIPTNRTLTAMTHWQQKDVRVEEFLFMMIFTITEKYYQEKTRENTLGGGPLGI